MTEIFEKVPEPTKTALKAWGYFMRDKRNTAWIATRMGYPESQVLDMIQNCREWFAQEGK